MRKVLKKQNEHPENLLLFVIPSYLFFSSHTKKTNIPETH